MEALAKHEIAPAKGNFRMCNHPTNPLDYLVKLGHQEIWRFILSHPDMDHLDGFNALMDDFRVLHFWDSGARKKKPDFSNYGGYREEDWNRYANVIAGTDPGTKSIQVRAGDRFKYANEDNTAEGIGDALYILAPDKDLINEGNRTQDFNDASYVVLYRSAIGKILLAGDAHDATWDYIKTHYEADVSDVALLIAPHHGRKSGRSYEFLDYVRPKLTCSVVLPLNIWLMMHGTIATYRISPTISADVLSLKIEQPDVWKFGTPLISHPLLSK